MTRSVLLCGGTALRREALVRWLDASFDVTVETLRGPLAAMRRLPNASYALILALADAEGPEARGIELVRFVSAHALHARVPLAFVGGSDAEREEARSRGARLVDADAGEPEIRALARDLLGFG